MTVETYLLVDPVTGAIRYVGRTRIGYRKRLASHMGEGRYPVSGGGVQGWVGRLRASGLKPVAFPIANYDCERDTIHRLIRAGCNLLNQHHTQLGAAHGVSTAELEVVR